MDYLTKFYKNKVATLQEQIDILEKQIELLEMDITRQTPEQIAAMNDPSRGGQSGKFGGDGKKANTKKKDDVTTTSSDSGPNSDWAAQQRHAGISDLVKDTLATAGKKDDFDTSPLSIFGSSPKSSAKKYDAVASSDDIVAKAGSLLSSMNAKAAGSKTQQTTQASTPQATVPTVPSASSTSATTQTQTQAASSGRSSPSIATSDYGRKPVQATSDPLRSTFKAGGYIKKPDASSGIGSIQLDASDLKDADTTKWAKGQLEQEVGFETKRSTPIGTPDLPRQSDVLYKAPTSSYDAMGRFREEEKAMIDRVNKVRGTNVSQPQYAKSNAIAGVDVEGPGSELKDMPVEPEQDKESLGSQLMRGFGDMGKALFGLNQSIADTGKRIQQRNAPKK